MSYTELIPFKNGIPQPGIEFCNAWGGAARIWTALFDRYVPKKFEHDSWICSAAGDDNRLWNLAQRPDLPMFERAVHAFTFDLHYVARENFTALAEDLRKFVAKYPSDGR